jgi:hypothetical protein
VYCPNCQRFYNDSTLRFCLEDGTALTEPPKYEQDAPTLSMHRIPDEGGELSKNDARNFTLLQIIIVAQADSILTLDQIFSISPRYMTRDEVVKYVSKMTARGILKTATDPNNDVTYYGPSLPQKNNV